jgi:DNA-binding NarL/FixJ family response regulator
MPCCPPPHPLSTALRSARYRIVAADLIARLTDREREVLTRVGMGERNQEIGKGLHISPATARTYVSRLLATLGARDRSQLVVCAYESGLLTPGNSAFP